MGAVTDLPLIPYETDGRQPSGRSFETLSSVDGNVNDPHDHGVRRAKAGPVQSLDTASEPAL